MSLEQALQENTNAILKLADLITANQTVISIAKNPVVITAEASVVEKEIETTATVEVETEQARDELQDASVTENETSHEDVKKALLSLSKKSRDGVVSILQTYGATNFSGLNNLTSKDRADIVRVCEQRLDEILAEEKTLETADA